MNEFFSTPASEKNKKNTIKFYGSLIGMLGAACLIGAACSSTTTSSGTGGASGTGGGGGTPGDMLNQAPQTSVCGGFLKGGQAKATIPMADPATYCEAEKLLWAYEESSQSLALNNIRMQLNCCGQHTIQGALDENGVYVITEKDEPELTPSGPARCGCECVFDFATVIDPVPAGTIQIKIVREVTDSTTPSVVAYEGSIDLSQVSGSIVISTDSAEPWCSGAI